jgi:hypothetical protein
MSILRVGPTSPGGTDTVERKEAAVRQEDLVHVLNDPLAQGREQEFPGICVVLVVEIWQGPYLWRADPATE